LKDERTKKDEYQKALSAYTDAMKEFHKGRFEKASELLRAVIEKHVSEREFADRAKMYLAICDARLKETRDVPVPKTYEDFCHSSVYQMNLGHYEDASKLLDKALKLKPEAAVGHYLMAGVLARTNQLDDAVEALKKAVQIDKFYKILAQNEADFESLWEDKRFRLLTRLT
jgi:tetratricopeptide (TPR) repeat protein